MEREITALQNLRHPNIIKFYGREEEVRDVYFLFMCVCVCVYVCMYWCMSTSMYCLYVGFDYTYIDVNTLAQGIKSFLASHVWSQAVAGAQTYGTDSPAITSQPC